jgi:two-component system sensor histidine kinase RpfC
VVATIILLAMVLAFAAYVLRQRRGGTTVETQATNDHSGGERPPHDGLLAETLALRAPMASMVGMTEVLLGQRLGAEQRDCVQALRASATNVLLHIEAMAGEPRGAPLRAHAGGEFNLHEMLHGVVRHLSPAAEMAGTRLELTLGPQVPTSVVGDSLGMRQLAMQMVQEAMRRDPPERIVIEASASADGGAESGLYELRLSVSAPMPAVHARRGLSLVRVDTAAATAPSPMSGQGVAVARAVAEHLGGRLYTEVERDGVPRLWAEVPVRVAVHASEVDAAARDGNVIAFDDPFVRHRARVRSMRILVAEDERANQLILRANLQRAGHRVELAEDGEQVLDLLVRERYDLVIIDMRMPGVSGIDVLKEARFLEAGIRRTPFVALSAESNAEVVRDLERLGVAALLIKPVVATELLDVLTRVRAAEDAPQRDASQATLLLPPVPDSVIDSEVLRELANLHANVGFLDQFTEQCARDAVRCLSDIERAGQQGAWDALREALQALRGVAGNLGARQLSGQCADLARLPTTALVREWRAHHRHLLQLVETVRNHMPVVLARIRAQRTHSGDSQSP